MPNQENGSKGRADAEFSDLFERFHSQFGIIYQFRTLASRGITSQQDWYENYMAGLVNEMKPGRELDGLLLDPIRFFDTGQDKKFIRRAAEQATTNALDVVDATSIVFAHSLLDDLLSRCLEIALIAEPDIFLDRIKEKTATIGEMTTKGKDEIVQQRLRKYLISVKRESLADRSELVHQLCHPGSARYGGGGYAYDKERIKKIDDLRHSIIHGPVVNLQVDDIENELDYIKRTGVYFWYMLHTWFGLQLIPDPRMVSQLRQDK